MNQSRYVFDGRQYTNQATDTIPGIVLITYLCAAFSAYERGQLERFNSLTILQATEEYFDKETIETFEIEFASPGEYVIKARRAALAITVALLVSATAGDISFSDARNAELINARPAPHIGAVVDPAGSCPVPVEESYRAIMNAMNVDRYNELCAHNIKAQAGVGLRVRVRKHVGQL